MPRKKAPVTRWLHYLTEVAINYYEHHLGDYARDTAHLSMLEHGAYRLLLDRYYATEKAIPIDLNDVFRLVRAKTKRDKEAVKTVISEFFYECCDGWRHRRCEKELAKERKKQAALKDLRERDEYRIYRDFVLDRDGHTCVYCGSSGVPMQLDHVIPRSRGGADTPENLAACCKPCNLSKGPKTPEEWRGKL